MTIQTIKKSLSPQFLQPLIKYKKKKFKRDYLNTTYRQFLKTESVVECGLPENTNLKNHLLIFSVSFNNPDVIRHQIRLIKKYVSDTYLFIVADNSTKIDAQNEILNVCKNNEIAYIRIPENPYCKEKGSNSHGAALNWLWQRYIKKIEPKYFGFIDHDIYPTRKLSIVEHLEGKTLYGHLQTRDDKWYLWPGFCFFEYQSVKRISLDFMPYSSIDLRADTGGSNWYEIYHFIDKSTLDFPSHTFGKLREGDCKQADHFENIGDWIHTFNASEWMVTADKSDLVDQLLNNY